MLQYKRILLKLSGEALAGHDGYGINIEMLERYAEEIKEARQLGAEIALVIGGGNIFRGVSEAAAKMDRVQADYMGMLATVINSIAFQDVFWNRWMRLRNNDTVRQLFFMKHGASSSDSSHVIHTELFTGLDIDLFNQTLEIPNRDSRRSPPVKTHGRRTHPLTISDKYGFIYRHI